MGNLDGYGRPLCRTSRRELFYQTPQLHRILRDGIFELNFHPLTMCSWARITRLTDGSVSSALGCIVACTLS